MMLPLQLLAGFASLCFSLTWNLLSQFLLFLGLSILWRLYKTRLVRGPLLGPWLANKWRPVRPQEAVLITGATSGIGLALAKHLYKLGYSVIATYYDSREPGHQELKQLASAGGSRQNKLILLELDVRCEDSIGRAYEECSKQLKAHKLTLYGLVNNAGLGSLQPFAWLQRKTIRNLIETNLLGNLLMTREFLPLLANSSSSRLIFVSSGLGYFPGPTYATYGATKCAQLYLAGCLNLELGKRYGVKSIAVVAHNFIKSTNICWSNVRQNEIGWEELKPVERELYSKDFGEHLELARALEAATKEHSRRSGPSEGSWSSSSQTRSATRRRSVSGPQPGLWGQLRKLWAEVLASARGEGVSSSLEQSGALECFEAALRLEDPPERMFAGDSAFQLIVGSLFDSLPHSCRWLLGSHVAPSLYR